MEANFAVKGSTGGWINNAHVIPMIGRVCDVVKTLIGPKSWNSFLVAFNMSETGCPIKPVLNFLIFIPNTTNLYEMLFHSSFSLKFFRKIFLHFLKLQKFENLIFGVHGIFFNSGRIFQVALLN